MLALLGIGAAAPPVPIATIDLSVPFATRSPWRFTTVQEPRTADPIGDGENATEWSTCASARMAVDRAGPTCCT